jgi:hypothetical protein
MDTELYEAAEGFWGHAALMRAKTVLDGTMLRASAVLRGGARSRRLVSLGAVLRGRVQGRRLVSWGAVLQGRGPASVRFGGLLILLSFLVLAPMSFSQEAPAAAEVDAALDRLLTLDPAVIAGKLQEYRAQLTDVEAQAAEATQQAAALEQRALALQQKLEALSAAVGALAMTLVPQPEMVPEGAMAAPGPDMMAPAMEEAQAAAPEVTFADHVMPIFQQRCFRCHSDDSARGGLSLTTIAAVLDGGSSGAVIEAGQPDASRLYRLIAGAEEPKMPPSGDPLSPEELELIKKWIALGAPADASAQVMAAAAPAGEDKTAIFVAAKMDGPPPMPEGALAAAQARGPRGVVARALATSPTASLAAVGSDRQVLLYDLESLELLGALPFEEGEVFTLTFSVNGELLVAGGGQEGDSGCAVVWNIRSGERIGKFAQGYDTVLAADISPDHRLLAVGGPNMRVRVYATGDGSELYALDPHTDWIYAVKFSPDGEVLATADRAGGLYLWQAATGRPAENLRGHNGAIHAMAYSADSTVLATAGADGTVRLWDTWKFNQMRSFNAHPGGVLDVAFARNGQLVSTGVDGATKRWNQDGTAVTAYEQLPDWGYQAALGAGDRLVLAGTWTGEVVVWDTETGERAASLWTHPGDGQS